MVSAFSEEKKNASQDVSHPGLSGGSTAELIASFRKQHEEIESQLQEIYARSGLSTKTLKEYLDNPAHFTQEQWELIQKERKELFEALLADLQKAGIPPLVKKPPRKDKPSKPPGARKNWIPVR